MPSSPAEPPAPGEADAVDLAREVRDLRNQIAAMRGELENERARRDEAIAAAVSQANDHVVQLKGTVAALRDTLEQLHAGAAAALSDGRAADRAEIAHLQAMVRALRDELESVQPR
jgi:chromosome segregation ATPase